MAASTTVKVRRDGTITLLDAAAHTFVVSYEDGNFSADLLGADDDEIIIRDRGEIVGLRKGDSQAGSLSWSVHLRELTNGSADVILDFINGNGGASGALTSTGGTGYEQFLLDIKLGIEGTDHGESADGSATFVKCLIRADMSEGDPDVLNFSATVLGGVTKTGQA